MGPYEWVAILNIHLDAHNRFAIRKNYFYLYYAQIVFKFQFSDSLFNGNLK